MTMTADPTRALRTPEGREAGRTSERSRPAGAPVGRREQRAALAGALEDARAGRGGAVIVRGDHGSGKTHLLDEAVAGFAGCPVFRTTGVEVESEIPYGVLQQLCGQLVARLDRLPAPQSRALAEALGLEPATRTDPALVGLGLLSLLGAVASEAERPVLCVLDDAEWIDECSAQAIGVAARRVGGTSVAFVIASGGTVPIPALAGPAEVRLPPLTPGEAELVLDLELPARLDPDVRQRILAEARGRPAVLAQVGRALSLSPLAGGFAVDAVGEIDAALELELDTALAQLADDAATALVVAAAEPLGEVAAFRRGCSAAGLPAAVERILEATGWVEIGDRVLFHHPLARHLVYHGASEGRRRDAHRALAQALEAGPRADYAVWHRAHSLTGPDEAVAARLERWSDPVGRAGGVAATAAFLERAAQLSEHQPDRLRRALAAASLHARSGRFDHALRLVAEIEHGDAGGPAGAVAELTAAEIRAGDGRPDTADDLVDVAARVVTVEPERAAMAALAAVDAVTADGHCGAAYGRQRVAARAGSPTITCGAGRSARQLLQAAAARWGSGEATGHEALARALDAWCADESAAHPLATRVAMGLLHERAWATLARRDVDLARRSGALASLPRALDLVACLHVWRAETDRAVAASEEAASLAGRIGVAGPTLAPALLGSWRGTSSEAGAPSLADLGHALVDLAAGRYEAALPHAQRALDLDDPVVSVWAAPQVVEAAVRAGRAEQAASAVELLGTISRATGSSWARGIEYRCLALLAEDPSAEEHFRESLRQLELAGMRLDLARTQLLYGEWLRRRTRRVDSRSQLRRALEVFDAAGATGFARRAWLELRASGEQARRRTSESSVALTEREAQVAGLAMAGHSNPAIGRQLFISPRTVEYHLNKVFSKVGITSRAQLRDALER